jgi:hypothetical protein
MRGSIFCFVALVIACGTDEQTSSSSTSQSGGAGGGGEPSCEPVGGGGSGDGGGFVPSAESIAFAAVAAVPSGEQILYNTWSFPDEVKSMRPDGTGAATIFRANRVWSLGVGGGGTRLAFSSADPEQEAHYGITLGDAIQHTFLYDFASQTVTPVAWGNINDECHTFTRHDTALWLCRRYDFAADNSSKGYRIGRLDLCNLGFEWITEEEPMTFTLRPQPTAGEAELFYDRIEVMPGMQHASIRRRGLPTGAPQLVHDQASGVRLSPDGARFVYGDATQQSSLFVANVDGSGAMLVAAVPGRPAEWSPDGSRIAYLLWDDAVACSHVEIVAADGSQAQSPTRIVDCAQTGESITELAWVVVP